MVKQAQAHHTAVASLSMLLTLPQAAWFRNRFAELNGPKFAVIKGGGTSLAGQIHAISLAQHLFGPGVRSVQSMGRVPLGQRATTAPVPPGTYHLSVQAVNDCGASAFTPVQTVVIP